MYERHNTTVAPSRSTPALRRAGKLGYHATIPFAGLVLDPVLARRVRVPLEAQHLSVEVVRLLHVRHGDADVVDSLHINHRPGTSSVVRDAISTRSTLEPSALGFTTCPGVCSRPGTPPSCTAYS